MTDMTKSAKVCIIVCVILAFPVLPFLIYLAFIKGADSAFMGLGMLEIAITTALVAIYFEEKILIHRQQFWWDTCFDGIQIYAASLYKLRGINVYIVRWDDEFSRDLKKHPAYQEFLEDVKAIKKGKIKGNQDDR